MTPGGLLGGISQSTCSATQKVTLGWWLQKAGAQGWGGIGEEGELTEHVTM
jgi:hypothetical protein